MPQKRFFRSRAHCNPLSHNDGFNYPVVARDMDWSSHYPGHEDKQITIWDIGCGFGGLTVSLAKLFPDKLVLGMEIRAKVCEYVRLRIEALRKENPDCYSNAACLRTNCMRYLPNFFEKAQIEKIFIAFPDPHFKAKNHRRRIVTESLLTEYAYFLKPNGRLYTITDVEELHSWHVEKCDAHPCFVRVSEEELKGDPCVLAILEDTEESKKVARMNGVPTQASDAVKRFVISCFCFCLLLLFSPPPRTHTSSLLVHRYAVYRRLEDSELPSPAVLSLFTESTEL